MILIKCITASSPSILYNVFFASSCCICKLTMFTSYVNSYLHDETFSVPYLPPGFIVIVYILLCAFLSVSAIHGGPYNVQYGTCSIWSILFYKFWGDATLTLGPYESTGTCIIKYATPETGFIHFQYIKIS